GRPYEERRVVAWVGKAVVFKGELTSSEDLTIDGRVEGTINIPAHSLTLGPDATIRADISAKSVIIHGKVVGTISATEKVVIHAPGSVEGDVISPRLALADGGALWGKVDTISRQAAAPAKQPQPALA